MSPISSSIASSVLTLYFTVLCTLDALGALARRRLVRDERGQASAEYALVLLGAAAVALLIVAWATKTDLVEKLLDKVVKTITGKVS
jgi:Flp pilus assembly pilin Flp